MYLDHNATTPVAREVVAAMVDALERGWGNPASDHAIGRAAAERLERARAEVAAGIGAAPDEIVFTSGGTESDNLAVFGVTGASERRGIVTSAIEHPAVSAAVASLEGYAVSVLPAGADGVVRLPDTLGEPALATLMLANNETGVLQPVAELARRARAAGAVVHTDAAQAVGKIPVDVDALGVDLLTIAGHKLYAPKGVGALYVRRGTPLRPVAHGGGQQGGRRPGTEAVAQAVGLGVAVRIAVEGLRAESARQEALRDELERRLVAAIPGLVVTGAGAARLPNTLHVRLPAGPNGPVVGAAVIARAGIAASAGSACHTGHASPVLAAMGVAPADAAGAVRLSLGRGTTAAEVERAADQLVAAWKEESGA